jgi:hypothetical protein
MAFELNYLRRTSIDINGKNILELTLKIGVSVKNCLELHQDEHYWRYQLNTALNLWIPQFMVLANSLLKHHIFDVSEHAVTCLFPR